MDHAPIEEIQQADGDLTTVFVNVRCDRCTPGDGYASVRSFCVAAGPGCHPDWSKPSNGQAGLDRWRKKHPAPSTDRPDQVPGQLSLF